ncbi:Uncharacterized protein APZ42_009551, partial [Daphnia magna]
RASIAGSRVPILAQRGMVPAPVGASGRRGKDFEAGRQAANLAIGGSAPAPAMPHRMEVIRQRLQNQELSEAVVNLLLDGTRQSTRATYQSAWNNWLGWCLRRDLDPVSVSVNSVLEYLAELHTENCSYSLLNIHRSMLSTTLEQAGSIPVGQLPSVKQLLRGAFNRNPPKPRYSNTWDVSKVVTFLASWGPNDQISRTQLSKKLTTLLALSTFLRVSELSSITRSSVKISSTGASFALSRPRKAQRSGSLQTIGIDALNDPRICPVQCLGAYLLATDTKRN